MTKTEAVTIGLIEHKAEDCPAAYKNKSDMIVPALREAAAAGQVPDILVFSAKDHGGLFLARGEVEVVRGQLPAIPHHEIMLKDVSADPVLRARLEDTSWLGDEQKRRAFIAHGEEVYYPGRFPAKAGPVVPGDQLADFIESHHE